MKYIEIGSYNPDCDYYNREACFGIYVEDGKILLALNVERNQIEMVGGGKQSGETNEECLSREFMEEIGAKIEDLIPFADIKCYWKSEYAYMCTLAHFFTISKLSFVNSKLTDHDFMFMSKEDAIKSVNLPYQKEATILFFDITQI